MKEVGYLIMDTIVVKSPSEVVIKSSTVLPNSSTTEVYYAGKYQQGTRCTVLYNDTILTCNNTNTYSIRYTGGNTT